MEKVESTVRDEERKRTNIFYVSCVLDRILDTFMHNSYMASTDV